MRRLPEQWIAIRVFTDQLTGERLEAGLAIPEMVSEREWRCAFRLGAPEPDSIHYAYGLDAFQALFMALEGIRTTLLRSAGKLSWEGGDPGASGFPRFVPEYYGSSFANEINRVIDESIERFAARYRK